MTEPERIIYERWYTVSVTPSHEARDFPTLAAALDHAHAALSNVSGLYAGEIWSVTIARYDRPLSRTTEGSTK